MLQDHPLLQVARVAGVAENVWSVPTYGSADPFWTISIEWWFYLAFGFVALVLMRIPDRPGLGHLIVLGLLSIVPAYYLVGGVNNCLTLLWMTGMGAALLFRYPPRWIDRVFGRAGDSRWVLGWLLVVAGAGVAMAGRLVSLKLDTGSLLIGELQFSLFMAVAVFAGLFLLSGVERVPARARRLAAFIGHYSYSLYLTHATVLVHLYLRFPDRDSDLPFFWTAVLLCHLVAIAFWWLFERHHRRVARWLKSSAARG